VYGSVSEVISVVDTGCSSRGSGLGG